MFEISRKSVLLENQVFLVLYSFYLNRIKVPWGIGWRRETPALLSQRVFFFTVWFINLRLCHVHDPTAATSVSLALKLGLTHMNKM